VQLRVDTQRIEAVQIKLLAVDRRRLQNHLELVIVLQPVGVLAISAVRRPARRLHEGGPPRLRAERPQCRCRMKGAGADLDIVGLQEDATLGGPVGLQCQDDLLKREGSVGHEESGENW
jgi:hypothetical protein